MTLKNPGWVGLRSRFSLFMGGILSMPDQVYALIQRVRSIRAESEDRILRAQTLHTKSKMLVANAKQIVANAKHAAQANEVGRSFEPHN